MDPDVTPTALFSPSKARQQRAQAQEWAHVDAWLSSQYAGRPVPSFERNDATLKALLALAAANERADDEDSLLEAVEQQALRELQQATPRPLTQTLLTTLTTALPPPTSSLLAALATLSTTLPLPPHSPTPAAIAASLAALTAPSQSLARHLHHADALHAHLTREATALRAQLGAIQAQSDDGGGGFAAPRGLGERTAAWIRGTRTLRAKVGEYGERLAALALSDGKEGGRLGGGGGGGGDVVARVVELESEVAGLREEVERVEGRVEGFGGLPMDVEGARRVVRERLKVLEELRRERDRLFEGLVER